ANGKVDRRALPEPSREVAAAAGYVAPRTPAEEILAGIWAQALGLERVGVHDNFFRLGGDSILSVRAITRAREVGLPLDPYQMFERQTIAELAAAVPQSMDQLADELSELPPDELDALLEQLEGE
ncbi:MAG TPA: hypothetical protein DD490_07075, partial [Acidobacteria bacterium]|nr:hypothetical protein [Acidobacteriota bacterium]